MGVMKKTSIVILFLMAALQGCSGGSGGSGASAAPPRPLMFSAEDLDGSYILDVGPGTLSITSIGSYDGMFTIRDELNVGSVYGTINYDPSSNYLRFVGSGGPLSYSSLSQPRWRYNGHLGRWEATIGHYASNWNRN